MSFASTMKRLRSALRGARGKIRVCDVQLLAGAEPHNYHDVESVGRAMQQLGWERRRCRFNGALQYGYVKSSRIHGAQVLQVSRQGRKLVAVSSQVDDRHDLPRARFAEGRGSKKKVIDASKKHAVTLTFLLDGKISPQELAQKLADRCGGHELMPGEAILVEHANIACVVTTTKWTLSR